MNDLQKMSTEELEALLATRRKEEKEREKRERKELEEECTQILNKLFAMAETASNAINALLKSSAEDSVSLREKLNNYGLIRSNSKGGFHIKDDTRKIIFAHRTECEYDFRASKAEELLKDFLTDFVKKRDIKMYNVVSALLERNKEGNLEYSRIQSLYSLENEFDDPRWKEAIRLFKESFKSVGSYITPQFYRKNPVTGKWQNVPLNISGF